MWFEQNQGEIIILPHGYHFNCINQKVVHDEDIFVLHYCGMTWLGDERFRRPHIQERLNYLLNQTKCKTFTCE